MTGIDLNPLLRDLQTELLGTSPIVVNYEANNPNTFDSILGSFNLYAIWVNANRKDWRPMYVGQRKRQFALQRLRQHLFKCPSATASKLHFVTAERNKGHIIGVTHALVDPDSLRLAIEEEIIYRNTRQVDDLPWNDKGRCA